MYTNARFQSTGTTSDFAQNFKTVKVINYRTTKFQSIWRTSDFETKFFPKSMTDKNFEKINFKIVISIQKCTPLQNFSHFVELQTYGTKFAQKDMADKKFKKINIEIETSI